MMTPKNHYCGDNKSCRGEEPTRRSCDVHGFKISGFNYRYCQSAGSWQVTKRKHQISQIHIILEETQQYRNRIH